MQIRVNDFFGVAGWLEKLLAICGSLVRRDLLYRKEAEGRRDMHPWGFFALSCLTCLPR